MEFLIGLVTLALDIWALSNIWPASISTGRKILWTIGIVLFPFIGFIIWLFFGPKRADQSSA